MECEVTGIEVIQSEAELADQAQLGTKRRRETSEDMGAQKRQKICTAPSDPILAAQQLHPLSSSRPLELAISLNRDIRLLSPLGQDDYLLFLHPKDQPKHLYSASDYKKSRGSMQMRGGISCCAHYSNILLTANAHGDVFVWKVPELKRTHIFIGKRVPRFMTVLRLGIQGLYFIS